MGAGAVIGTPTLPRLWIAWHSPGASEIKTAAVQNLMNAYLFGPTSPLFQSLVLGQKGDQLETVEKPDVSQFTTLDSASRGTPPPAPPKTPLPPEKRPPLLDVLAVGLGTQSYAYRVSGRQVRDGVWAPSGILTSTIEEFTAVRRLDDKEAAHVRRGSRPWDDLGKAAPSPRDQRIVDILNVPVEAITRDGTGGGIADDEREPEAAVALWAPSPLTVGWRRR